MNNKKKVMCFILIFLAVICVQAKVLAVSEKYEVIESKGWGTVTDVVIKNTLKGNKATEYIVSFPKGSGINMKSNSNPFCIYPLPYVQGNYIYFPLNNSCKTEINYTGLTNGNNSSNFQFNVFVDSSLPELKKCSEEQKSSLNFEDSANSECYYCASHQCLGDIKVNESTKEVGIIYKEAKKPLQIAFGLESRFYQKNNKYTSVSRGSIDSIKSLKDKSAIVIKLNGQVGKTQYLTKYNDNSISGAGTIEVGQSGGNSVTTLTKSCSEDDIKKIKNISGVGTNLACYYCDLMNCKGNIKVETDVNTVAIIYRHAMNSLKISLDGSEYFQSKNAWQNINYHSIKSIYSAKGELAILLNLTGKDGTIKYDVKYNDKKDAGTGNIIIGNGQNPEGGQTGDSLGNLQPGEIITGCEVIPEVVRKWINNILKFVRYVALALVIALGALDFMKAAGDGEPDAMKKAGQAFMKRMIAVVILFLLPVIVDFILNMINIYGVDTENIDCMKNLNQ